MNKSILLSLALVAFVGAAAVGATGAFFSDTETSTGNTFTAGAIDLRIDNSSYAVDYNIPGFQNPTGAFVPSPNNSWLSTDLPALFDHDNDPQTPDIAKFFFNFVDLKPGDIGEDTISLIVDNNNAYACMALDVTATPENNRNEAEIDVPDNTPADGELQDFLRFTFWNDDGDNVFEVGETPLPGLTDTPASSLNGQWQAVGNGALTGATTYYVGKAWCFGAMVPNGTPNNASTNPVVRGTTGFTCSGADPVVGPGHNIAQTDGVAMDVAFYAVQARNNGQFSCTSLRPLNEQPPA